MDEHRRDDPGNQPPLILRRVPPRRDHLARELTGAVVAPPCSTWWELVDPATADDLPPVGVALTDVSPSGAVHVLALGAAPGEAVLALTELLQALVAVLRGHVADVVHVRTTDHVVVEAVLAAGFSRKPGDGYVLTL